MTELKGESSLLKESINRQERTLLSHRQLMGGVFFFERPET
jgi:hypothetical protein